MNDAIFVFNSVLSTQNFEWQSWRQTYHSHFAALLAETSAEMSPILPIIDNISANFANFAICIEAKENLNGGTIFQSSAFS